MKTATTLAIATLGAGLVLGTLRRRKRRDLRGQTALITGSSRGLGFLLAREYARQGCRVVLCARGEEALDRARDQLRQEGADVLAIPCDLSDRNQVEALVEEATAHFGSIDILVNNAGIIQVGPMEDQSLEDFEKAMDIIFYGSLYTVQAVLPQMIARRAGRIVNITSIGAKMSVPHLLPYNCAKFAALGLSEGLRAELRRHNIAVTTIVPGLMRTGSYVHALFKGKRDRELRWFSLGSSLPGITVNAERAARKIVKASQKQKAEFVVGAQFRLAALIAGVAPGVVADAWGLVNSLILPKPAKARGAALKGQEVSINYPDTAARLVAAGTALGRRAGGQYNQR